MITKYSQEELIETVAIDAIDKSTTPSIHLKHIDDVRLEMAKVYRDMKQQKILAHDGTRLVYVLTQIGKMIELHDIEKRVNIIEERL